MQFMQKLTSGGPVAGGMNAQNTMIGQNKIQ